jgi:hypothetical protein
MPIEIDEMKVDIDDGREERAPATPTPAVAVEALRRHVLAALADEEARRQRLVAD